MGNFYSRKSVPIRREPRDNLTSVLEERKAKKLHGEESRVRRGRGEIEA